MYRSTSYASQVRKSAFVEMSEGSAEAARLLREAGVAEPEPPTRQTRSLASRAVCQWVRIVDGLGKRVSQLRGTAQG